MVVWQKLLSSSKKGIDLHLNKGKTGNKCTVFSRRICFYRNEPLTLNRLTIFATQPGFLPRCSISATAHPAWGKKATIALGHTFLAIISQLLSQDKDYEELGGNSFDEWDR
jgi:hypothetical protein